MCQFIEIFMVLGVPKITFSFGDSLERFTRLMVAQIYGGERIQNKISPKEKVTWGKIERKQVFKSHKPVESHRM